MLFPFAPIADGEQCEAGEDGGDPADEHDDEQHGVLLVLLHRDVLRLEAAADLRRGRRR